MSNQTNIVLGGLIVGLIFLDLAILHTGASLFLARKMADLIEFLAFWR